MTGRDKLFYLLGVLVFFVAVFLGRDLSNPQELLDGAVMFLAMMIGAIFIIYIRGRGGTGPVVP